MLYRESKKLPDDGRPLPKHVGAYILNKEAVQFSAYVGWFWLHVSAEILPQYT
jgi:hypothetical protein